MVFTIKKLHNHIDNFLLELKEKDFHVRNAVLFGSYANGNVHENSDIDLAIWADEFNSEEDNFEKIKTIIAKYYPISPKLYYTKEIDDSFIEIINKTGKTIKLK